VKKKCKTCDGRGGSGVRTCNKCGGSGQVRVVHQVGPFQQVVQTTCDSCNGLGETVSVKCKACNGDKLVNESKSLNLTIPRGVESGDYLVINGEGEDSVKGSSGDLIVFFNVLEDKLFDRQGSDLFTQVSIDLGTALLGGSVKVEVFDKSASLKIPKSTQSHTVFKLSGLGLPKKSRGVGDLFVKVVVDIPKNKKSDEKKLREVLGKKKEFKFGKGFFERFK